MARRAEDLPPSVVVIEDEHSALDDDEYRAALDRWLREVDSSEAIEVLISAADTLRAIREHDEA
jgi:hypothetical protein